jgi:hypothetical protein
VRLFDPHIIVALLMFAIFSTMVGTAAGYRYEARLVPLVVGIPAMLLAAWQLYSEIRTHESSAAVRASATADEAGGVAAGIPTTTRSAETESIGWLLLVTGLVLMGGMVAGGTIGVMMCQRIWLRESWRTTAMGGVVAILVLHFCFERALGMALFEGWLVAWIGR